jgi:hypothetical protein
VAVGTTVTNNSIEEELRLTVAYHTETIHFCHHKAIDACLMRRNDLCEDVSMENSMLLFDLCLEWIGFFMDMVGRSIR